MGWLIALGCLLLVWLIPLAVHVRYDRHAARMWVTIGPFPIPVYPRKQSKKNSKIKAEKGDSFESSAGVKKKESTLTDFLPLLSLIFDFILDFSRKLKIDNLYFKLVLAEDDPCDLSVNYARAWTVIGNLIPCLERCFNINKRNIEIECDYTADSIMIDTALDFSISLGNLLCILFIHGRRILRKYFEITKRIKDGAIS